MAYIGSLDQGTSSTRFMIFDHSGQVVGQHQLEHRQILPQAGWVEHDAAEIWERVQEVIAGALKQANILGSDLAAIGLTNQRGGERRFLSGKPRLMSKEKLPSQSSQKTTYQAQ